MAFSPSRLQKLVLIVRTDIGMSQGKVASQCAHATLECYIKGRRGFVKFFKTKAWLALGQPKIVLRVSGEEELMKLASKAKSVGLTTAAIRDAGRTQLRPGTVTVLGIGPDSADKIDSVTSHLRLL